MLWSLFITFLKLGLISFGGGYAMIPVIQHEVESHGWLSLNDFNDAVALAGMSPGPIATNSATIIGFKAAGLPGAAFATMGMVLPSLVVIILIAGFFYKSHGNSWVKASLYGLKPIVTGLILYAAIHFFFSGNQWSLVSWHQIVTVLIAAGVVVGVLRYRLHPFAAVLISGLLGMALFQ